MAEQDKKPPEQREAERAKPTREVGISGLLQWGGLVEEAYLPELRYPAAYAKFNEMRRRDPTIASLLNAIKLLIRNTILTAEPGGNTDADKTAAEFLEQCLDDMSITKEDAVEDLLSAVPFGWSWAEIVYKRRAGPGSDAPSKYDDGRIGWRKWAPRRQSTFDKWQFDDAGGVQGLWQSARNDLKIMRRYVPIEKSIHFVADRDGGNPEGLSVLESIYEAWHYVKNLQIVMGIGFERSFVGLPKFTYGTPENPYEPDDDDIALVNSIGKALRVDEKAFVSLPGNIEFELVTTENSSATSLLETIKQFRIWMYMVVLADFLALGTVSTGGSYALGQDKSELFLMACDGWLDRLVAVLNRYAVPRLFGYNDFGQLTDLPQIVHTSVQKPNLPALASFLQSLSLYITPTPLLETHLRQIADLPEEDVESLEREREDADVETDDKVGDETGDKKDDGKADEAELARPRRRGARLSYRKLRGYERVFNQAVQEYRQSMRVK